MPTIQDTAPHNKPVAVTCPLCNAPLNAEHPTECTICDWVAEPAPHAITHAGTFRDRIAVVLSIVPGLGHMYKGHTLMGVIYTLGSVFAFLACVVAATFTAGFGLLLLPVYWLGTMLHVYWIEDRCIAPPPAMK
jgi:hypothetical protein